MVRFKFRYEIAGGHTHVRVFCGDAGRNAFGKCGDLVFRNEEWELFMAQFRSTNVEFIREETV